MRSATASSAKGFRNKRINSFGYLFGTVDEELAVVHALEDLNVGLRTEGKQVSHLRFGGKGSSGAASRMAWLMISSSRSKTRERILPQ